MASYPIETHRFASFDGVELAWHETGDPAGRPVVLIHGYVSTAEINWIKYGHAAKLAERGFRVILPDLRGHGQSSKPHDAAAYPPDVLMRDGFALLEHLELTDYDLGGYSLGGRTTLRMLVNGARPRRAALCGMGLAGLTDTQGRGKYFHKVLTNLGSFERGTTEWMTEAFLKTTKADPAALLLVLQTFVDTSEAQIAVIDVPTVVVSGAEDYDNGSSEEVAELLPHGRFVEIPGNHMSAVSRPELGDAIVAFLADGAI